MIPDLVIVCNYLVNYSSGFRDGLWDCLGHSVVFFRSVGLFNQNRESNATKTQSAEYFSQLTDFLPGYFLDYKSISVAALRQSTSVGCITLVIVQR